MKSKKVKTLSIILALILAAGLIPIGTASAADVVNEQIGSSSLYWSFTEATGVLEITGTGAMPNMEINPFSPWRELGANIYNDVKKVIIGNSVTSIGNSAFYGCSNLTDISIGNSVTSIGSSAFYGCSNLKSINLPNSVESIVGTAFQNSGLESITIPPGVTNIGGAAFYGCSNLETVVFTSQTPPSFGTNVFHNSPVAQIIVPSGAIDNYKTALSGLIDFAVVNITDFSSPTPAPSGLAYTPTSETPEKKSSSAKKTEWRRNSDGTWYFYEKGKKVSNAWRLLDGQWYYFKPGGAMAESDWVLWNGIWYYLNHGGAMVENVWVWWNGIWYWLGEGGEMAANERLLIDGRYYRFDPTGACLNPY